MLNNLPFILFYIGLALSVVLIVLTLVSLPKLGDERSTMIKQKAQSDTFSVVVGILVLDVIESLYVTFNTADTYTGTHPIILLTILSIVYLIALLFAKKKYGG